MILFNIIQNYFYISIVKKTLIFSLVFVLLMETLAPKGKIFIVEMECENFSPFFFFLAKFFFFFFCEKKMNNKETLIKGAGEEKEKGKQFRSNHRIFSDINGFHQK